MQFSIDRDRLVETMQAQAEIGGTDGGGLNRVALSDADKSVRDWFLKQMEAAGLETRIDEFGNMFGRREGTDPSAGAILIGSHLDSQAYGGIYDGCLGVVAALETVRTLNDEEIETQHPIEIVNWTNEEGARFDSVTQGSGVWAGQLDIEEEYQKTDSEGKSVESELERIGYKGNTAAKPIKKYDSGIELHIEQGTRLEQNNADVGVVTGVAGLTWGAATFHGTADHSGTTQMSNRNDAFVAAADTVVAIRRLAGKLGNETVGTVGRVETSPNSINVVPGEAEITWDLRDPDDNIVETGYEQIIAEANAAAEREGIEVTCREQSRSKSVDFDDRLIEAIEMTTTEAGYDSLRVFSGATHDAINVAKVCDAGMIFAVSEGGRSHTESEYTSWDDCYSAANTLANVTTLLATEEA